MRNEYLSSEAALKMFGAKKGVGEEIVPIKSLDELKNIDNGEAVFVNGIKISNLEQSNYFLGEFEGKQNLIYMRETSSLISNLNENYFYVRGVLDSHFEIRESENGWSKDRVITEYELNMLKRKYGCRYALSFKVVKQLKVIEVLSCGSACKIPFLQKRGRIQRIGNPLGLVGALSFPSGGELSNSEDLKGGLSLKHRNEM